jgi:hypothetical protein
MGVKTNIKLSRTNDDQLLDLANSLGVQVDQIDFKQNMKMRVDYAILNMDFAHPGGGTHWLALSNKHKAYFDPLGLPRPRVIPPDYTYREIDIQNPRFGHCGQFCVLWLYYLQHGKLDDFFKLFHAQKNSP